PQIQFELISVRVDSLSRCGNTIDQQPDLARLEQLAARAARTDAPHHALHRWIRLFSRLGESEAENQAIARLKAIADADRFPRWRAIALQHEGRRYTTAGRWDEARATLEAALGLFQSAGDPVGQVECLCYLTDMFAILVRPAEMNAYLEQAQAFLKTSNDPFMIIRILQATYVVQFAQQDSDANLAVGQRILDIAREIGDLTIEAVAHIYLGNSLVALGNLKETERHYAQALALYGAMADRSGQAGALINLGYLSLQLGLATQAMDYFNQAAETFGQIREWRGQLNSWCGFCRAALMKADYRQAHRAALKALEQARTLRLQSEEAVALLIAGCAERELGVLGESRRYLEAAVGVHRDLRQPVSLAEDLSELIATYVLMGERSLALAHADELLMLYNDHSDNLYAPQSALWAAAQAYALAEQPAVAADLLERAWAVMHEKAAALADPGMRESFLNLPKNRQILAAVRERRGVARTGA
ncbi:MAG TPA: hypothetical protein VD886_17925, partial [Herpetosiphonaceae bacterium]|nr:hypothetical protein [Herpetosiphonaceae bacterium]